MRSPAALIVGGGVAGGALAIHLARRGERPVVLEREAGAHHKVCGEFVSGEAVAMLAGLGVDVEELGGAPIGRVRLVRGRRVAEAGLPFRAWGVSRLRLDAALLAAAEAAGAEVRRGVVVRGVEAGGVWVGGEFQRAGRVFLATGKHEMRGIGRGKAEALVGLKLHVRLAPGQVAAVAGCVELYLLRGGYVGLQMVEEGVANLCLIGPAARFGTAGRSAETFLGVLAREGLGTRLAGAVALWARPLAVARVPYGWLHRGEEGFYRVGDQAAVIASLTGDGMAMALHSAGLAAEAGSVAGYQAEFRRDVAGPMRVAGALHWGLRRFPGMAVMAGKVPGVMVLGARRTRVAR